MSPSPTAWGWDGMGEPKRFHTKSRRIWQKCWMDWSRTVLANDGTSLILCQYWASYWWSVVNSQRDLLPLLRAIFRKLSVVAKWISSDKSSPWWGEDVDSSFRLSVFGDIVNYHFSILIRYPFRTFPEKIVPQSSQVRSPVHRTRQLILSPKSFVMLFLQSNMFS